MLYPAEERDKMVGLLLCVSFSKCVSLPLPPSLSSFPPNTLKTSFLFTCHNRIFLSLFDAVLSGIMGNQKQAREFFLQSTKLVKRKNNNLEKFCARRVSGGLKSDTRGCMRGLKSSTWDEWRSSTFGDWKVKIKLLG